jgi:hypothetical protein
MKFNNIILIVIIFFELCVFGGNASAQIEPSNSSSGPERPASQKENADSISRQKDVIDVAIKILRLKGLARKSDSVKVKPGKLLFAGWPAAGYTLQTGITALFSANISFLTGKSSTTNLSSINVAPEYSIFNHQVIMPLEFNIWFEENKYNFLGDLRYFKYPSYTYGLGSHTSLSNSDLIDYSYYRIYQQVSKRISVDLYTGLGYALDYHYNISDRGNKTDFRKYNDSAAKTISSGILFNLAYDSRHNINNPQGGAFASITFRPNLTFLGSNKNWQSMQLDFRKYIRFPSNSNNILAVWNFDWLTFGGKAPYLDLPSTGWDTYSNLARGYIQGRLRGTNLIYLEFEYRISILRNGLLGCVIFSNAQSVCEYPTNKFETILPAVGTGLRTKINKFSNVNFAIDYAYGAGGSHGVFFNICEVF